MTHSHGSSGDEAAAAGHLDISDQELASLHASDISACKAIVILLLSILTVGLLLYLGVAWWVTR